MIALILAAAVFAFLAIPRAVRADRAEYHLFHGPASDCIECEGK